MKKWIALLLAAVMCLSLAACGDGKPQENSGTAQGQTTDNFPQDTDEPSNGTDEPSDAELTEQTVEITLDNWQDYFEIKQYLNNFITANAFGEPEGFGCYLSTVFTVKEEYAERFYFVGSDVAIEYSGDYILKNITVDVPHGTFKITGNYDGNNDTIQEHSPISSEDKKILVYNPIAHATLEDGKVERNDIDLRYSVLLDGFIYDNYVWFDNSECEGAEVSFVEGEEEYHGIVNVLENIEITRIQGTLVFSK